MNSLLDEIISEAYGEQEGTPIPPYTTPPLLAPPTSCPPAGQTSQKTVYGWSQYRRQRQRLLPGGTLNRGQRHNSQGGRMPC